MDEIANLPAEELEAMGSRGREWVKSEFAWDSIAETCIGEFQRVICDWVGTAVGL